MATSTKQRSCFSQTQTQANVKEIIDLQAIVEGPNSEAVSHKPEARSSKAKLILKVESQVKVNEIAKPERRQAPNSEAVSHKLKIVRSHPPLARV